MDSKVSSEMTCSFRSTYKPMSISAITQPIFPPSPSSSSAAQPSLFTLPPLCKTTTYPHHAFFYRSCPSPPVSPEEPDLYSPSLSTRSFASGSSPSTAPLTLQERRLRNKAASAKYRQKKNQQQNEMRRVIDRLSEHNVVLEQQLRELRKENAQLRLAADKMRGKMVAKTMLRQWVDRQRHGRSGDHALSVSHQGDTSVGAAGGDRKSGGLVQDLGYNMEEEPMIYH